MFLKLVTVRPRESSSLIWIPPGLFSRYAFSGSE
jgi:hypothetical protein